jgi:hypothetical protein
MLLHFRFTVDKRYIIIWGCFMKVTADGVATVVCCKLWSFYNCDFGLPPLCCWDLRYSGILTQRRMVILYGRFGTTYRVPSSWTRPLKMWPIGCPETSVKVTTWHCSICQKSAYLVINSVSQTFLVADPFWLQKITTDPQHLSSRKYSVLIIGVQN